MKPLGSGLQLARQYEFGPFTADPVKRVLRRDGEIVALTGKTFDLLMALIANAGEVVEKDDLLRMVWPDTIVEENNLVRHVSMLRKTLNDNLAEHLYIVTVAGRGYRFVAEVNQRTLGPVTAERELVPPPASTDAPAAPPSRATTLAAPLPPASDGDAPIPTRALIAWMIPGVLALIAGTAAIAFWLGTDVPAAPPRDRAIAQFTFDPGSVRTPSWSPDGRTIAFSSDPGGNTDIWTQPVGGGSATRLTDSPAVDDEPNWSPDGRHIVFRSEREGGGLFLVPATGGAVRKIADFGYRPVWSPDGSRILFVSSTLERVREAPRAYVVSPSGGGPHEVLATLLPQFNWPHVGWHPDGRLSVWGNHRQRGWSFWTAPVDNESKAVASEVTEAVRRELAAATVTFRGFTWAPSARALFFEGVSHGVTNVWRIRVDPQTLRWTSGPERLTTGPGVTRDLALSSDGRHLAFVIENEQTRLWSFPFDAGRGSLTGAGAPLTATGVDASSPDITRDGTRLAYRLVRGTREELWQRSLRDGREELLTSTDRSSLADPHWSPDGRTLAYRRRGLGGYANDAQAVVLLSLDNKEERLLTTPGTGTTAQDWLPDGSSIVGRCAADSRELSRLCVVPVSGAPRAERSMRLVASSPDSNVWQGRVSPDGRWIVFNTIKPTAAEVSTLFVVSSSGGPWTRISKGPSFDDKARWAPDGKTIYFVSNRTASLNIWGQHFDPGQGRPVGEPFQVTTFESSEQMLSPSVAQLGLTVARDRLVFPMTALSGNVWVLDDVDR